MIAALQLLDALCSKASPYGSRVLPGPFAHGAKGPRVFASSLVGEGVRKWRG